MNCDDIIDLARERGFAQLADQLEQQKRPCVRLRATANPDVPEGASKLGGTPDLPADFEWPVFEGRPLAFIAQLALDDIPHLDPMPQSGYLWFFYEVEECRWGFDPKDAGSFRVVYSAEDASSLQPQEPPDDVPEHGRFPACELVAELDASIPSIYSIFVDTTDIPEDDEIWDDLEQEPEDGDGHQLLGHPLEVQGDMAEECQLVTNGIYCGDADVDPRAEALKPGAKDWRLLLQVDTDDSAEMMWGDCGRLYYWIREQDLEARDFDQSWLILQCT